MAQPGRPQGGSTITQQLAKTLLVGNDITYERKLREIIIASNIESNLSKTEILELYLNSIYLGRGAWGVEMAARGYFGKSASALTPVEGALIAGLAKGPSYFNPDRNLERARDRFNYVLGRMVDDGMIASAEAKVQLPPLVPYERLRQNTGYHFVDHVSREARAIPAIGSLNASSYVVRSTINPELQRATESVLQEALARYELNTGRYKFEGAEANIADALKTMTDERRGDAPAWLAALKSVRLPLYDVHWEPAVVLENGRSKRGEVTNVGLMDGRIVPLNPWSAATRRSLQVNDVVYVRIREAAKKQGARAELRVRRFGKSGEFLGCLGYPKCSFTSNFKRNEQGEIELVQAAQPQMLDEKCPQCGKPLRQLVGKFGPFIACSGYPDCKYIKHVTASFPCPLDGGQVVQRRWRGGSFWGCNNYPKCKFAVFGDIEETPCPKCKLPFLVKKVDKDGKVTLFCSDKNCGYKHNE